MPSDAAVLERDERRREARLRGRATRRGFRVHKSRRTWGVDNLGGYMLVDAWTNGVVAGARFELSLDELEAWLADDEC